MTTFVLRSSGCLNMVTIKEDHDSRAVVNNDAAGEGGWPEDSESVVLHVVNPLVDKRFFILCKLPNVFFAHEN